MSAGSKILGRDQAIDVIRGVCIVSMILSHTARDSPLDTYLHLAWVDGASGFFLMAGLVLGMVQRRTVDTKGLGAAQRRFARRLGIVYAAQLILVAAAIAVAPLRVNDFRDWPHVGEYSGRPSFVLHALTLQVNPKDLDVLPVYIMIFAMALVALPVLVRFGPWPVAIGTGVVYVLSTVFRSATTLPRGIGDDATAFSWGCWQALFFSGFLVGWYWREKGIGPVLLRRTSVLAAAAAGVVVYAGATLVDLTGRPGEFLVDHLVDNKHGNAPGRVVLAWLTFVVLYGVITWLLRRGRVALVRQELATLGRRSLDAYVVLGLSVSLSAVVPGYAGPNGRAMALAVSVCLVALLWAHVRDRRAAGPQRKVGGKHRDAGGHRPLGPGVRV